MEPFQRELARHSERKMKRGIPKGKYVILRLTWDKVYKPDLELYEKLSKLAESKNMKLDAYCKDMLREHVESKKWLATSKLLKVSLWRGWINESQENTSGSQIGAVEHF